MDEAYLVRKESLVQSNKVKIHKGYTEESFQANKGNSINLLLGRIFKQLRWPHRFS